MSKYWWEEKNRWAKTDEQKMLRWAKEWWARFLRQMSTLSHRWATPTTVADSKKLLPDMKILNVVSNSPTYVPTIPKIFWPEISAMPEISTDFEPHTIIEFHIYGFILPILQVILGKNMAKTLQKFYQYEKSVQTDVFKNFKLKLLRNFSPTHNQTLFLILCLPHRYLPPYFVEAPA